jgi:thymidine phosphorylase
MTMNIVHLIEQKRDGTPLDDEQIHWFIERFTAHEVPDHQAAAMLMAIVFRGLDDRELATWTGAMVDSGVRIDLGQVSRPTVDKHSTGGVGDKISLILCPLVAACGAAAPQVSGRGLGHTGGTLDKLESIPGWSPSLDLAAARRQLDDVGCFIIAASADLAPADRRMYALRDVTGTVASIPLIASSIMSKKIASGTDALVLDVKVGRAAFLRDPDDCELLARTMVGLGEANGVRTRALLTGMDTPLGLTVGNALEVAEAVECLAGGGPPDVRELTLALAREMLDLVGIDIDPTTALDDGAAMDHWRAMVTAQGGDPDAALPRARHTETLTVGSAGVIQDVDALAVGRAAWVLGAGRAVQTDPVSATAGVQLHVRTGDQVNVGQPLMTLHTDDEDTLSRARHLVEAATVIGDDPPPDRPLIRGRIDRPA